MSDSFDKSVYNESYYQTSFGGIPYNRDSNNGYWLTFFSKLATQIKDRYAPVRTLDVGCAKGFVVEALRDLGVSSFGFDVSETAIQEVREDISSFCRVGSIDDSAMYEGMYDLITCIEVVEHVPPEMAEKCICLMCAHSTQIIFSSSPDDFDEPTHINVQAPRYWDDLFAKYGFAKSKDDWVSYYIAPHTVIYKKNSLHLADGLSDEINSLSVKVENANQLMTEHLAAKVDTSNQLIVAQLGRIFDEKTEENRLLKEKVNDYTDVIDSLQENIHHLTDKHSEASRAMESLQIHNSQLNEELTKIKSGRAFRILRKYYNVRDRLLPLHSKRREFVKAIVGKKNINKSANGVPVNDYELFLAESEKTDEQWRQLETEAALLSHQPLISVIVPVYNVDEQWLRKCIDSVRAQIYVHWELCVVDDCSTKKHVRKILEEYMALDDRIRVHFRTSNGHISESSNDGLRMANGEWIALLDHDDEITPDALYENIRVINEQPNVDIIYSDEDKISETGVLHSPFFKPDWSPETFLSYMYTCHLAVYRQTLVDQVGGFRKGLEGSQDYDLMLRVTELSDRVHHIPRVLYHWRTLPQSTALASSSKSYTHLAGQKSLEEALQRRGVLGWVEGIEENLYRVHYKPVGNPLVSILIPTRNMSGFMKTCLKSIFENTDYTYYEVVIIDNGSDETELFELFDQWKKKEPERFKVIRLDIPFNYSVLNNEAAKLANGELLLLLNNDIEVLDSGWLGEMVGQAIQPGIGAVGACLYYPDRTIQHGGVIIGVGGVAGHSHKHFHEQDKGYFNRLRSICNYSAVTAACLMIRKNLYLELGGLDERLQVAFNDVDFCLKVIDNGFRNVWLPHVQLIHHESKSRGYENTPEKQRRFQSEIKYVKAKWGDRLKRDPYYNPNLTLDREDYSLGSPYMYS